MRPEVRFDFRERPLAESHSAEYVEAGFEREISKIDIPAFEALVYEVKARSRANISGPPAMSYVNRQTIRTFEIYSDHISELSKSELYIGSQIEVATENGTNSCVYANQENLGI